MRIRINQLVAVALLALSSCLLSSAQQGGGGGAGGGGGGSGTVTSVGLAGTANQITVTGSTPITTSGSWTLSLTSSVILGTDNATAGTIQLANGSSAAHTIFGSGATTTNTILGFATVPVTGHIVTCTTVSTTCTLTDGGAPGAGTVTSVTFTGDGTILSSTPSSAVTTSGTLLAAMANAAAGTILGNATGASTTPTYTANPVLGVSGTAGTLSMFPASGNFTTILGSAATATNTVNFFATVPTNLHLFYCAVATTVCTFTDTGYAYNSIPNADLANSAITIAGTSVSLGGSTSSFPNPGTIGGTTPGIGDFSAINGGVLNTTAFVLTGYGSTSGTATLTWPGVAGTTSNPIVFSNTINSPSMSTGTAPAACGTATGCYAATEGTASNMTATTSQDAFLADATAHAFKMTLNN